MFLQTDRNFYAAGETVWMKAWLTLDGKPGFLSKILYIDLVNDEGKVMDKKMLHIDCFSSAAPDFLLSNSLKAGIYQLRAYTLWMLNFKDFLFTTHIFIMDPGKSTIPKNKKTL